MKHVKWYSSTTLPGLTLACLHLQLRSLTSCGRCVVLELWTRQFMDRLWYTAVQALVVQGRSVLSTPALSWSELTLIVHCNLVIAFMLGDKLKESHSEMSVTTKLVFGTAQVALNMCTYTGWSKKASPNFKRSSFLNFSSTKKVKTSPWSKFTWEFKNYTQMPNETKANIQVVIASVYNTSCNRLKQRFSCTTERPLSPNDVQCVPPYLA